MEDQWQEASDGGQDRGSDVWELRTFVGRDAKGRVRHRSITFRGSKRAAERELARFVTEQEEEPAVVPQEQGRGDRPPR